MIQGAMVNLYAVEVEPMRLFYEGLGLAESFRTPTEGPIDHVELKLQGFTLAISDVKAAVRDHGLDPDLGGRPAEIVLWTDDLDGDLARLVGEGAPILNEPHNAGSRRGSAWVRDPEGNPVHLVQEPQ